MRRSFMIFLFLTSVIFSGTVQGRDDRELILWGTVHNFATGSNMEQGPGDLRIKILISHLPEFRHEIAEIPLIRIYDMLKAKPNLCTIVFLQKTPEREAIMEFSAHSLDILPNQIITTRTRLPQIKPYINERGELDLSDLLNKGKHRISVVAGQRFSDNLDALFKAHIDDGLVVATPSINQLSSRILKLVHQSDFGAIVGYSMELRYALRELGLKDQDFITLPIAGEPPLAKLFAACSKSELGKRAISLIDRAFANRKLRRELDAAYRNWLDKESAAHYDRLLARFGSGR